MSGVRGNSAPGEAGIMSRYHIQVSYSGIRYQVPVITFISSSMALLSLRTPRQNCRLMSSRGRLDFTLFWWI